VYGSAYNIYFANGGVGGFRQFFPSNLEYRGNISTPEAVNISREGYRFVTWNTQPDGSGTNHMPGEPWAGVYGVLHSIWEPISDNNE